MISRGGLLSASVRPADALRAALELGAVTFVMAHNHPGGDPAPSADDVLLTQEIEHAAHLIDVPLRDHLIVTPAGRYSSVFRAGSSRQRRAPAGAPDPSGSQRRATAGRSPISSGVEAR
jgi:DNA repair protein RadC